MAGGPPSRLTEAIARFRELGAAASGPDHVNPGRTPSLGATVRVVLADNEAEARARGRSAWRHFDANITKLWRRFGIDTLPGSPSANGDFDQALQIGLAFAGTPAMFVEYVAERAELGIDPLLLGFEWGDLDAGEVRRSFDLFAEHVMPVAP